MEETHAAWLGERRSGGGGGFPIARPIGVMMILLACFSVIAHKTRQSQIAAALLVGLIFGASNLTALDRDTALEKEVNLELIEVGNALVLFFAGLSVEVEPILKYWYAIICVGLAQLAVSTGLFAAIGYGSGLCVGAGTTIFFGVACSLSSKQVTLDFFSNTEHQSPNSMHGRLLSGLGLFQDAIAVVGFALLQAFERTMVDPNVACVQAAVEGAENASTPAPTVAETGGGHSARRAELFRRAEHAAAECVAAATTAGGHRRNYEPPDNVWHSRLLLGDEIGRQLGLMILVGTVFVTLNKTFLGRVVSWFCLDGEMLFIGTMAYNLGACAICSQIGFSPMVGSYFAGLSLAFLPSQVQIQNKIASLRAYGMTTFYFMMGIYVAPDGAFFRNNFGWSILITLIVVFVSPVGIWVMGWAIGLKSRTTVYTSLLSNSLGETTLTLQVLAYQAGIFQRDVFLVLVVSTIMSISLCCFLATKMDLIYSKVHPFVAVMDAPAPEETERESSQLFRNHVVILGFTEAALEVAELYRKQNQDVYVIELDYKLHETLRFAYKGTRPKAPKRAVPLHSKNSSTNFISNATKTTPSLPSYGGAVGINNVRLSMAARDMTVGGTTGRPVSLETPTSLSNLRGSGREQSPYASESTTESYVRPPQRESIGVFGEAFGARQTEMQQTASQMQQTLGVSGLAFGSPPTGPPTAGPPSSFDTVIDSVGGVGIEWPVDGNLLGGGTNIWSIYADPELRWTWDRYNLKGAKLVVSCMVERQQIDLCEYLADSNVPMVAVCNDTNSAEELYDCGCTFVLQQNYMAAAQVRQLLEIEFSIGDSFESRALDHQDDLAEEKADTSRNLLSQFF